MNYFRLLAQRLNPFLIRRQLRHSMQAHRELKVLYTGVLSKLIAADEQIAVLTVYNQRKSRDLSSLMLACMDLEAELNNLRLEYNTVSDERDAARAEIVTIEAARKLL